MANASSQKEESRKKIIETKELPLILYNLEHGETPIIIATANIILSISRAHMSVKKYLNEYGITNILFRLTNHPNIEVQILVTNSLCNFLLDTTNVT
jgi:hypothetical protein